jgi:hypothetical protein
VHKGMHEVYNSHLNLPLVDNNIIIIKFCAVQSLLLGLDL